MKSRIISLVTFCAGLTACDFNFYDSRETTFNAVPIRVDTDARLKIDPAWSPDGTMIAYSVCEDILHFRAEPVMGADTVKLGDKNIRLVNDFFDLSPDGTKIVYVSADDRREKSIKVLDLRNGIIQTLNSNFSNYYLPSWSPDGQWIAFSGNLGNQYFHIFITHVTGESRQLTFSNTHNLNPSWSPDSRHIAFQQHIGKSIQIWIVNINTLDANPVVHDTLVKPENPDWSPDGRTIAYEGRLLGKNDTTAIFTVGIDGNNSKKLTSFTRQATNPAWSHDGTKIAFRDGDGYVQIVSPVGEVLSTTNIRGPCKPVWYTDNSFVTYSQSTASTIEVVSLVDFSIQKLTEIVDGIKDLQPAWFPDNKTIAFVRATTDSIQRRKIWTCSLDDRNPKILIDDPESDFDEEYPAVSPDGKWMVLNRNREGYLPTISLLRLEGTQVNLIQNLEWGLEDADWNPTSNGIVAGADGDLHILTMDSGYLVFKSTIQGNFYRDPSWSVAIPKRSEHIAADIRGSIAIMSPDGNNPFWAIEEAVQPDWSPDGRKLVYCSLQWPGLVQSGQIYIAEIFIDSP
ncbi:MAG TPA: hypothetical protein VGA99_00620 [bacterium]